MKVLKNSPEIRRIEITYSKSGVTQKADFRFEEGNLATREMFVNYEGRVSIPDSVVSIMDLVKFIASYSFTKRAIISSINGRCVTFEHRFDKTSAEIARAKIEEFEDKIAEEFFLSELVPIIKKKKWFFAPTAMTGRPTIAYINEEGEPDNVSHYNRMLKRLDVMCQAFKRDKEFSLDYFVGKHISTDLLKSLGLYKEI